MPLTREAISSAVAFLSARTDPNSRRSAAFLASPMPSISSSRESRMVFSLSSRW